MIPFSKDIHPYIREADAIVNPSYHEGMSNVLMEASATGRPCIASDISGCREIVVDGSTGFLFKPKDAQSLINALDKFINLSQNQRREMGRRGRTHVEEHFDRQKITETYMREIRRILSLTYMV